MNNKSDKVIEAAKGVNLSAEEKSVIRGRIADFVASQAPVASPYVFDARNKAPASGGMFSWIMMNQKFVVPAFLFLMVFVGGGASALAEKSLPGDALYPLKLNVNETMESVLAFDAKEAALVDINQATRRLSEAEALAESGKLTEAQDTEIKMNFSKKVESVNNKITKLENKGDMAAANEIREKLEIELDSHERILTGVSQKSSSTLALLDFVKSKRNKDRGHDDDGGLAIAEDSASSGARMFAATSAREDVRSKEADEDDDEYEGEDDDATATLSIAAQTTTTLQAPTSATTTVFTMAQVMTHNASTSCYTVVKGSVYDLTKWIKLHPGGSAAILSLCGKDGTTLFLAQHAGQTNPEKELATFKIGILKP